jgi:alpha-mannosidase
MNRLFHEKSEIGHYSKSQRDFEYEYESTEYEENPKDAEQWLEKAKNSEQQIKWEQKWQEIAHNPKAWHLEDAEIFYSGHSHIDVAWLWRYLQTVDKVRVTFSKACYHIDNVPEFSFTASQCILLDFCRIKHPTLFIKIQKAVKMGRFELAGGSWCEPDTHIPSGESWVRQRLYGQLFYKKYFGKYATIEWVPDSFGFTSSLPQILVKSNAMAFHTHKLSDNDTNQFPFTTFWWESPDGSRVLTEVSLGHIQNFQKAKITRKLLKPGTQESTPKFNYEREDFHSHPNFSDEYNPYLFLKYGKGDGGHGPTGEEVQEHVYHHRKGRWQLSPAQYYFDIIEEKLKDRLPVWRDELYYEYHRGTLTSHALVKKMNRYNEWTLPSLEIFSVLASLIFPNDYQFPTSIFDEAWKMTLLNQFHDVLPGTCIPETYDDCWDIWNWQVEQYGKIEAEIWRNILPFIPSKVPEILQELTLPRLVVFNPSSYEDQTTLEVPLSLFRTEDDHFPKYIISEEGDVIKPTVLPSLVCPDEPLYNLPGRIAIPIHNIPTKFSTFYIIDEKIAHKYAISTPKIPIPCKMSKSDKELIAENEFLRFSIDTLTGAVISLKIVINDDWIETIQQGPKQFSPENAQLQPGMKIHAFYEHSKDFPAWNMDKNSRTNPYSDDEVKVSVVSRDDIHIIIKVTQILITPSGETGGSDNLSHLDTYYTLFHHDPMIYVDFHFDFRGQRVLLKYDIPTATQATRVESEVAFAYENRNTIPQTARDKARWENLMHTWINLQKPNNTWGFSIINKGKYGVDYRGGYLGITLLHGQTYFPPKYTAWAMEERMERMDQGLGFPPSWIDQGNHVIRLALYPHPETIQSCHLIEKAHGFNTPKFIRRDKEEPQEKENLAEAKIPILPSVSFPIEISALKFAHIDGDWGGFNEEGANPEKILILRTINMSPEEVSSNIDLSTLSIMKVVECDLLERREKLPVFFENQMVKAKWKPFEIKTFAIRLE